MARFILLLSFIFTIFIAGCVPSRAQHNNIVNAINNRPVLIGYTKDYIAGEFGPPSEVVTSGPKDRHTQTWIYKTNYGEQHALVNIKPGKTRYMKLTFVGNTILDSNYE